MGFLERFLSRFKSGNSDLEMVMREMASHPDMKVRRVLYLELLKGTLLLPLPKDLEPSLDGKPIKELQLVTQPGEKGELLWLAFTSRHALHQWRPQFPEAYAAIKGQQVFALAVQNKVDQLIINPAGPVGGRITRMEVEMLAEGTLPIQGGEKIQTVLARPNTPLLIGPLIGALEPGLLEYFRGRIAETEGVYAAYLASIVVGGGTPHLLLGIFYRKIPPQEETRLLMAAIGQDVGKFLARDEFVDMVPMDDHHEWAPLLKETGTAVYRRKD